MAVQRPLLHLPLVAGACVAAYAGALVLVTDQQAALDRDVAASREPLRVAAAVAQQERLVTTRAIRGAADRLRAAAGAYDATIDRSAALDDALESLAALVTDVSGAVSQLPARISLPAARVRVVTVTPPTVQAVTGASGG
jgi:hypothetical protein